MRTCVFNPQLQDPPRTGGRIYAVTGGIFVYLKPGENVVTDAQLEFLYETMQTDMDIAGGVLELPPDIPTGPKADVFDSAKYKVSELRDPDGPLQQVDDIALLRREMKQDERKGADRAMQARIDELRGR